VSPSESNAAQPRPGTVVGKRYRLESLLGEGGMAVVWRATHTETDRPVALKLVRSNLVANEHARELFVREAKIAARVGRSEHIVDVLDAGIDDALRVPFLAMELLEGEPFDVHLQREGPLAHERAEALFTQLGEALDQAHAAGVVHRDLKPQNLFLSKGRKGSLVLKVLDFGIAKLAESQHNSTQIGTPAYAAPEQLGPSWRSIAEGRGRSIAAVVSPQTDVWAVGLVVFEALTGAQSGDLWGATTLAELPLKVVLEPTPTASIRAGARAHLLPPGFDAWLARCLDIDATRRFPSAGEAIAALSPLLIPPSTAARAAPPKPVAATVLPSDWAGGPPAQWAAPAAPPPGPPAPASPAHYGAPPAAGPPAVAWPAPAPAWGAHAGPPQQGHPQAYAPQPAAHVTTGSNWAPPDPQLAAWAHSRRLEIVQADIVGLRALGAWIFIPPLLSAGREARGLVGDAMVSLVEMTRGDAVGRATGDDRLVLALVTTPRSRARAAVRSRQKAGFADNVARGLKALDNLVGPPPGATSVGDPLLESYFEVSAPSRQEGHAALTPALRTYLVHQRFRGTLELRAGLFGLVHFDVARFEPRALDYMLSVVTAILSALP